MPPAETIVLVPGLWMNAWGMNLLERRFRAAGYGVVDYSYPSISRSPRENAADLAGVVGGIDSPAVHFVCHSLGGLLARHLFHDFPAQRPGRVVTLGTPHGPSRSAGRMHRFAPGRLLLGRSVEEGLLGNVPPWAARHELGSVAGSLGLGLGRIFPGLPRPNDGTVTVEETRLEGMADHAVLPVSHFGMLLSPRVAGACLDFIRRGRFAPVPAGQAKW